MHKNSRLKGVRYRLNIILKRSCIYGSCIFTCEVPTLGNILFFVADECFHKTGNVALTQLNIRETDRRAKAYKKVFGLFDRQIDFSSSLVRSESLRISHTRSAY